MWVSLATVSVYLWGNFFAFVPKQRSIEQKVRGICLYIVSVLC